MANELLVKQGTDKVWKNSGGDYAITLAGLAVDAGRCGVKGDLGATFARRYAVTLEVNMDVAPTAGRCLELYWAASRDNTTFPGGATGTDAAYKAGEVDEWKRQLGRPIGCLSLTADADGTVQTQVFAPFTPPTRYGCPVLINKADQALEGDEDSHKITFTPLIDESQ
ncbi:MAG: hypothetical protein HQ567_00605 [Candidatus Nealsonbacteria bacterium]|nr:hypothetical protein [Candidatus Nealsonbacteria bacterium]